MRLLVFLTTCVMAAVALPAEMSAEMPEPGELALLLGEEEFEDYLDKWLAIQEPKWANASSAATRSNTLSSGCTFKVNGDLGQPQPVYVHKNQFLKAADNYGMIYIGAREEIRVACTGSGRTIRHPNIGDENINVATAICQNNDLVFGDGWLRSTGHFGGLTCSSHSVHEAQATNSRCFNNNIVIRVGFIVDNAFHTWYYSCFDQNRLEVLYVWYEQNAGNAIHQTGVDRPSWLVGSFFPGYGINNLYTQVQQKQAIANIVGQEMADRYVTTHQFLARGHLSAKSDYVFATGQRSSFYFINAAPQWQPFNAGNWNWLEQNLRARIGEAKYDTIIYTGTYGVTQLRDANGVFHDIYLHKTGNTNQLPVPLYFYKVAFDSRRRLGTVFISINNPHYTAEEVRKLQFCTDRCRNNDAFSWLRWQPDRIDLGYSFCCTIADFQKFVPHLPPMNVDGLLA